MTGDYTPPDHDDITTEMHLKALKKKEQSRNRRQGVISKLMEETQRYREQEIRSLEPSARVKETMTKYKSLQNPTEVINVYCISD